MSNPATTTLSSKCKVVIPEEIRVRLGLTPGTRFVVVAEGDVVAFKVLQPPEAYEFAGLVAEARAIARELRCPQPFSPAPANDPSTRRWAAK